MKTGPSLSRFGYSLSKIRHRSSKFVNFIFAVGCLSLDHSKNINIIGRECPNFEGDGWMHGDIVGKMLVFPKAPLMSLIFLWVVAQFIAVTYCILNFTNSFRKVGRGP